MGRNVNHPPAADVSAVPVEEIIRSKYEELSAAERKAADYVLSRPEEIIQATVHDLAQASGVSDATVVRMCYHLGYRGYYDLRVMLARDQGRRSAASGSQDSISLFLSRYAESIRSLGDAIEAQDIRRAIDLIRSCRHAHILAVGNTMPLSLYMSFRLSRLGIPSTSGIGPEYFLGAVNLAEPEDLVIAISKSGESRQVIGGISLAREKHLPVLVITGNPLSPAARQSDCALITGNDQEASAQSRYSLLREFALIDALLELLTNWDQIAEREAERPEDLLAEFKLP